MGACLLYTSFQNRFNPGSLLIKNTLEAGELGKILSARAMVTWDRSDDYYQQSDWKGTWEKEGGGVVIDQAIHTLDLMNWFIQDEIEYVEAQMGNRAPVSYTHLIGSSRSRCQQNFSQIQCQRILIPVGQKNHRIKIRIPINYCNIQNQYRHNCL